MSHVRPFTDLLRLFAGPAVWFAHFTVVYGAEALICTPPIGSPRAMVWTGLAATVVALAALIAFAIACGGSAFPKKRRTSTRARHFCALRRCSSRFSRCWR